MLDFIGTTVASGVGGDKMTTQIQHYFEHPEDFQTVVQLAMSGDKSVLPEVQAILDAVPQ